MAAEDENVVDLTGQDPEQQGRKLRWPWESQLVRGKNGVKPSIANCVTILTHHHAWKDRLAWDDFRRAPVWVTSPDFSTAVQDSARGHGYYSSKPAVNDDDRSRIAHWLSRYPYGITFSADTIASAVRLVAKTNHINTLADFLCSLRWDGVDRIGDETHVFAPTTTSWLRRYLGVDPIKADPDEMPYPEGRGHEYVVKVGRWFLLQAVARALNPGCQADYFLVLEGGQGIQKTSALQALFYSHERDKSSGRGEGFHEDTRFDLDNKEMYMLLEGRWGIEFGEGEAFTRASTLRAKQFITERSDTYVPKYSNEKTSFPRMWVGIITINPAVGQPTYLKDDTGGRRFWPVLCESADIEAIMADRDQLWAQAVHLYQEADRCLETYEQEKASVDAIRDADIRAQEIARLKEEYDDENTQPHCTPFRRCPKHRYWPSMIEQRTLMNSVQETRSDDEPWTQRVMCFVAGLPDAEIERGIDQDRILASMEIGPTATRETVTKRVAGIMTRAGFKRTRQRVPGAQKYSTARIVVFKSTPATKATIHEWRELSKSIVVRKSEEHAYDDDE